MAELGYEIAVGWNNTAGLTNIEDIIPAGAVASWVINDRTNAYFFVDSLGTYNRIKALSTGSTLYRDGYAEITWALQATHIDALAWFYDTYVINNLGKLTIATTVDNSSYSNYSAFVMPETTEPANARRFPTQDGIRMLGIDLILSLRGLIP